MRGQDTDSAVPPSQDFNPRDSAGVGLGWSLLGSDTHVEGCELAFSTHPLVFPLRLLERNSWGSWPGSCPFLSPCLHLEESMGPSSPPPGECLPGPSRARYPSAVRIALYMWGACLHQRGSVWAPGGGACAAHVMTHDVCGFKCGGKKNQPSHLMSRGAEG